MDNRIYVFKDGGGGRTMVGMASGIVGMKVRFHNQNTGASDTENKLSPTDYIYLTAIGNGICSGTGIVSGKTYSDYDFFTSVPYDDDGLTGTGAQPWPTGTSPMHYPFV